MARDVFSLLHFPMLCGIIAYAAAIEHALAHPGDPFDAASRIALGLGLALFVVGLAIAFWRATGRILRSRVVIGAATAIAIIAMTGVSPAISLAIGLVGVAVVAVVEQTDRVLLLDLRSHGA